MIPARVWVQAARLRTLPASVAPIVVGSGIAWAEGRAHVGAALASFATALLLQIAANLANDVFDFEQGADTAERTGPPRVTQQGLVSPRAMRVATAVVVALAALAGSALVLRGGWPIAVAGLASIAAALAYTGGPWPLGYHGLGDLTVFVFFGGVGVIGSHYVQALTPSTAALVLAVPVGLLATAILVVNNLRDIATDARVGKRTLAVRMGAAATRRYYVALVVGAAATVVLAAAAGWAPRGALLALGAMPLAIPVLRRVLVDEGAALNASLGATARLLAVFSALLAVGCVL